MRLANPATLPDHPLLTNERLQWFLLQEQAKRYETMLLLLNQRSLQIDTSSYQVTQILKTTVPHWETKELSRGHYRVGARDLPAAYDNELPAQAVELTSFRIALDPVSNAEFLAFMEADGYQNPELWDETGQNWLEKHSINHPEYWRQEKTGNWYAMGVNGPSDLPPNEPISGINRHEAQAFANWISALGGKFEGAVLQHEYQWEIAVRTGVIKNLGRAWEWCSNPFHPYPDFQPFPARETSEADFDEHHFTQRGGSLHTQRVLRRPSLRDRARPERRFQLVGLRLVFPPLHEWT
ncbi:SUMF1/EgtB/PvdO family nonheme iron enzyme [endosymbiont of Lamellibrachia barhami]|uniref:SUMF1/EgtB/PvdO family nonheme iron enzyme n=1 Tax=endosymbiont of Lamellibrachia barhami TaxID=205975 RepID=UPI0015A8CAE7|nr:SUMF1/EgtB/PvdO family nonheme iron enzyme [endosymbiont of Lamellibrachia barhami]